MKGLFNKSVGIQIMSTEIRAVELSGKPSFPQFIAAGSVPLPEGAIIDGEIVDKEVVTKGLKDLWSKVNFTTKDVLLGVSNQKVIVRFALMDNVNKAKSDTFIRFQAQDFLPVPIGSVELDYMILTEDAGNINDKMKVLLVAAEKEMLMKYVEVINSAGLNVVDIDVSIMALSKVVDESAKKSCIAIAGIEHVYGSILVMNNGMPALARPIPNSLLAKSLEAGTLDDVVEIMGKEIQSSMTYFNSQTGLFVDRIYITGDILNYDGMVEKLENFLKISVESAYPFNRIDLSKAKVEIDKPKMNEFSICVGLAIRGLEGR